MRFIHKQSFFSAFLLLILSCLFTACSNKPEEPNGSDLQTILKNHKWILHTDEFNVYSTTELEYREDGHYLYFISDSEGWDVTVTKIVDTFEADLQKFDRDISKFEYNVNGNKVFMYYSVSGSRTLTYSDGVLSYGDLVYEPLALNSSDREFLRSEGDQTGNAGSGVTYSYNPQTKVLTFSGSGAIGDYNVGRQPWNDYVIKKIVCEEGITAIGANAFYNVGQSNLQSVELPQTLRTIGEQAFAELPLLQEIIIPSGVNRIYESAFASCSRLSSVKFETNADGTSRLIEVAKTAFNGCSLSGTITIPNSVQTIGFAAFSGSFNKVVLGNRVTEIGDGAFNSSASSGRIYVNRGNPPSAGNTLTRDDSRWTLYVPRGAKSSYQKKTPWSGFGSIQEDSSLDTGIGNGAGGNDDSGNDDSGNDDSGNDDSDNDDSDNETNTYTSCPDSNHPHMINLGLPSGTKWACCNVGAKTPEKYGNYYAWGETKPKSVYDWDTYAYGSSGDNVVNIGSDIAGTQYDAATVNWGAPWRMPSLEQYKELLNSCTSTWTTKNGVYVRKFTGPNGGTIFLPAAGSLWYKKLYSAGSMGTYWSSTLNGSYPYAAEFLGFNSYHVGCSGFGISTRCGGNSVRPVR